MVSTTNYFNNERIYTNKKKMISSIEEDECVRPTSHGMVWQWLQNALIAVANQIMHYVIIGGVCMGMSVMQTFCEQIPCVCRFFLLFPLFFFVAWSTSLYKASFIASSNLRYRPRQEQWNNNKSNSKQNIKNKRTLRRLEGKTKK